MIKRVDKIDKLIYIEIMESLGKVIKKRRLDLGLSQKDVSKLVGMDKSYLSDIERGKKIPWKSEFIFKLAGALSINGDQLQEIAFNSKVEDMRKEAFL